MMFCEHGKILFARFFNPYTTGGTQKTGFFGNFDFSELYSDLDILSEIVPDLIDAYLYNEYSTRYVSSSWSRFMVWDKANKRYNINTDFYSEFAKAFCGHLMTAQNFFDLTKIDFSSLGDYIRKTKIYGNKVKTTERGDDITTVGEREDTREEDIKQRHTKTEEDIKQRHTKTEEDIKQRHTKTEPDIAQHVTTTENTRSAFNSSTYENDNKSTVTESAYKDQIDVTEDAHKDQIDVTEDAHKDQIDVTEDAHKDKITLNQGEQETTNKYGTITERDNTRTDVETIDGSKGYDREKLLNIKKELASMNVYQLIGDAIVATMLTNEWGW